MATPQIQNDPIYLLPLPRYIDGLNIGVASNTVISIAPGQCRDNSDNIDMPVGYPNLEGITYPAPLGTPAPLQATNYFPPINPNNYGVPNVQLFPNGLFVNSAIVGANGLDQGTLAASSSYLIYLIGDSRNLLPTAGILSLYSNAFPLLPSGYDSYRLLGWVDTNSSTHFVAADVLNYKYAKQFMLQPEGSIVSGGSATTFTAEALTTYVPTTTDNGVVVVLDVYFIPAAVGDTVQFRPTGSAATAGLVTVTGIAAGVSQQQYVQVIAGVSGGQPSIDYKVTSSSDSVSFLVNNYTVTVS
jgi:hypothetical protein